MGARPLKRAIQTEIEDKLAEEILQKNIKPGDKVTVTVKNKKIEFNVKSENEAKNRVKGTVKRRAKNKKTEETNNGSD